MMHILGGNVCMFIYEIVKYLRGRNYKSPLLCTLCNDNELVLSIKITFIICHVRVIIIYISTANSFMIRTVFYVNVDRRRYVEGEPYRSAMYN